MTLIYRLRTDFGCCAKLLLAAFAVNLQFRPLKLQHIGDPDVIED